MTQPPDRRFFLPEHTDKHESPLRSLMAETAPMAEISRYMSLQSLTEAQADPDGVLIMEGDDGGAIYVVCPARLVRCSPETLVRLLHDIDALVWDEPDMAHLFYQRAQFGQRIAGGMGGGLVVEGIWAHEKLEHVATSIRAVITGTQPHLDHSTTST